MAGIVTGGGLVGKVTKVEGDIVEVEIASWREGQGHQGDTVGHYPDRFFQASKRLNPKCWIFLAGKCG
jgi:hypothetical protein